MSRSDLATCIHKSVSLIESIERGERVATEQVTTDLESVPELKADGMLLVLREEMKDGLTYQPFPLWFHEWPDKEAAAARLRWFEALVMPGLLQTEDYARAVFSTRFGITDGELDELVPARLKRQEILERDGPPELMAIIDEGVLHREMGGRHVMAEQVARLVEAAQRPNVMLQVIRTGAHEGLRGGAFIVADFEGAPSVAYQDTALRGQYIERAEDVAELIHLWDTLRGEALPRRASLAVLEDARKSWTAAA